MKKVLAIILVLGIVMTFAFAEGQKESKEEKQFLVGITTFSTQTVFSRNARECVKQYIEEKGGKYIDNVATDNITRATAIETFIAQGVDAIILLSGSVTEVEAPLNQAKAAGIVIGSCDAGLCDAVDIYASSDNFLIGKQVVEALVNNMVPNGNILKVYSNNGSMDRERMAGGTDILSNPKKHNGVTIKYDLHYVWPDYFEDCKTRTAAILLANGHDVNGIFATFDGVGLAALQAVREAGLEKQIPIVGVDGEPEALNEIANPDSAYYATVIQSWTDCARVCVNEVFNKLNGGEISSQSMNVPGILVTKENVEEIRAQYPELFVL